MKIYNPSQEIYLRLGTKVFGSTSKELYLANPCSFRKKALLRWNSPILRDLLADMEYAAVMTGDAIEENKELEGWLRGMFSSGFYSYKICIFIAIMILDTAPYSMVLEFADQFHRLMIERMKMGSDAKYEQDRLNIPRVEMLEMLEAEECITYLATANGDVRSQCVRFINPQVARYACMYVWKNYLALRAPLFDMVMKYLDTEGMSGNLVSILCEWAGEDPHYALNTLIQPLVDKQDSPKTFAVARTILDYMACNQNTAYNVLKLAENWWNKWMDLNCVSREFLLALSVSAVHGDLDGAIWKGCFKLIREYTDELFENRSFSQGARLSLMLFMVLLFDENEPLFCRFIDYICTMAGKGFKGQRCALRMLTAIMYADALLLNENRPHMLLVRAVTKDYICYEDVSRLLYMARQYQETKLQNQMLMEEQLRFIDLNGVDYAKERIYYRRMAFLEGGVNFNEIIVELDRIGTSYNNPCEAALKIKHVLIQQANRLEGAAADANKRIVDKDGGVL